MSISRNHQTVTLAIASGQQTSQAFPVGEFCYGSLQMPGTITSTTATLNVTNQTSDTWKGNDANFTFSTLPRSYDDGSGHVTTVPITLAIASGHAIDLPPETFKYNWAQLVMGSDEGGARTVLAKLTS